MPKITPSTNDHRFIGIMTGTSLDGIDVALVNWPAQHPPCVERHTSTALPADLRQALFDLQQSGGDELHRAALAANLLSDAYSRAVNDLLAATGLCPADITAIGAHGQTVRHRPELGYTLQLNNGSRLAEQTGIDVIADFRSRDIAAGGQGAPLVPAFHRAWFHQPDTDRVIINIGGISNLSWLPAQGDILGFDSGPGNVLMDSWIQQHGQKPYDANGEWAAGGQVIPELLAQLLAEPFLRLPPPKSTGRDLFSPTWLARQTQGYAAQAQDVQATLCEFTAQSIADSVTHLLGNTEEAYLCGGGAYNGNLLQRIRRLLPHIEVKTTDALGMSPQSVEAAAFAWLARQFVLRQPGNHPAVTGAQGSRILGALYPA